jgi:hypothetical protein
MEVGFILLNTGTETELEITVCTEPEAILYFKQFKALPKTCIPL